MSQKNAPIDKAGKQFWNESWACSEIPEVINPANHKLSNVVNRRFHQLFTRLFEKSDTTSMRLLEIGCAKSAWLPYFSREFGFSVTGIDGGSISMLAVQIG